MEIDFEKTAKRLHLYLSLVLDGRYTEKMLEESLKKSVVIN